PTIFNLLGPLTNPAGAEYQLVGTSSDERARLLASALSVLGCRRAMVVCGNNELDEVCLWGPTRAYEVAGGRIQERTWTADDFGLPTCDVRMLRVKSAAQSASMVRDAIEGKDCPATNIVLANSAAALFVAEQEASLTDAVARIRRVLSEGKAAAKLQELCDWTSSVAPNTK
ncbi:MAG: anthranilate phosphoribosyltransferase, partial [Planctomycetaceae bacterium]|nr:anthranilate phosphoribosyltransferase [Planctomycetaceae bacterium]